MSGAGGEGGIEAHRGHHEAKLRDLERKRRQTDSWPATREKAQFKEAGSNPGGAFPVLIR